MRATERPWTWAFAARPRASSIWSTVGLNESQSGQAGHFETSSLAPVTGQVGTEVLSGQVEVGDHVDRGRQVHSLVAQLRPIHDAQEVERPLQRRPDQLTVSGTPVGDACVGEQQFHQP